MDPLLTEIRQCRACVDLPLGPNPILKAHASARVLIAGQAPGRITHQKSVPFDDPSGDRLRDWLGVDRNTFYNHPGLAIVPMGFCFPGTGKGGDLPPRPECARLWHKRLFAGMNDLQLKLVIGRYAIDWHLPAFAKYSVTDAVKASMAMVSDGDVRALVLPHPSPRNNRWLKQNPWFEADVIPHVKTAVAKLLVTK